MKILTLEIDVRGNKMVIHPVLLWDEANAILIDAGVPGLSDEIKKNMEEAGVPFSKWNRIILTHQDFDHIGSLPELLKQAEGPVEVLAHKEDKPYIEGEKPLIKMDENRKKQMLEAFPEEQREEMAAKLPPKASVTRTIEDGEKLPYCGGITVIFTPGHTPGHISLYLHQEKMLVAGDAMVVDKGVLNGPNASVTPDMEQAKHSIGKFTGFDIEKVLCYHGGLFTENPIQRIKELAAD